MEVSSAEHYKKERGSEYGKIKKGMTAKRQKTNSSILYSIFFLSLPVFYCHQSMAPGGGKMSEIKFRAKQSAMCACQGVKGKKKLVLEKIGREEWAYAM